MSKVGKSHFLMASCFAALLPAGSAMAQQTADEPSSGVEEIVVTAQRRSESVQDVPLSVSVVTAGMAEAMGVTSTASLEAAVPGLQFTRSLNNATPALRGIGSNPSAPLGSESAVATYIDGVYITSPAATLFSFNNIERIEVLKGPQGTLFGRNATGGVVQVITRDPQFSPTVNWEVGYGNYETIHSSLYASSGLTSNIAADVALFFEDQNDGWGNNLANGEKAFTNEQFGARTKWLLTPGERTRLTFAADYNRTKTDIGVGQSAFPGTLLPDGITGPAGFYNYFGDFDNLADTKQAGASLNVAHDMDWAKLVSISSYRNVDSFVSYDADSGASTFFQNHIVIDSTDRTITQELQLLSPTQSSIDWIAGLFYFNNKAKYDPLSVLIASADIYNRQDSQSYAAYAQGTGNLGANTRLTLGLRHTTDEREQDGRFEIAPVVLFASSDKAKFSKLTYRIALDHRFSSDFLGYASYNRGFQSGLYNLVSPGSPPVKPEVIDAFEVGFKSDLLDERLQFNVAGYYYKFKNLHVSLLQGTTTTLVNAGESDSKGFEVEMKARPFENLRLSGAVSYIDANFTDYRDAIFTTPNPAGGNSVSVDDATGNRVPRAPEWSASLGGQYTVPTSSGDFQLAASYYYNDGFFWDPENRLKQPSYSLLSASIGWESSESGLSVRFWGKNLLDEKYYSLAGASDAGDLGSPAPPLTFGATIGYQF